MKKWFVVLATLLLASCAYSPIYNGKESYNGSRFMLTDVPRHTLDFFVEGLTEELIKSNTSISAQTPLAVTSFVDLQEMNSTNWLGNAVPESFIYQFQRRGFKVVDYKTTGAIRVTKQGDFAFSRDWKDLSEQQNIKYVLTGTMLRQSGGVMINARVVAIQSRIVVASAQGFLPGDRIGRDLDSLENVRMEGGTLIRSSSEEPDSGTVILRP